MEKYIGAHVSASGGVENAPLNAREIGATAFALFTKNQRQWKAAPLTADVTGIDPAAALRAILMIRSPTNTMTAAQKTLVPYLTSAAVRISNVCSFMSFHLLLPGYFRPVFHFCADCPNQPGTNFSAGSPSPSL